MMKSASASMKLWQWVLAAITALIAIVTFLTGFVYTNAQGKVLEDRVTHMEEKVKTDEANQREDILYIRDKIDAIYKILIQRHD